MLILIQILILTSSILWAKSPDLCDFLDLESCSGVTKQGRRTSSLSLPSPATSALLNPSTVSFDRGLGLEMIHQNGNPLLFNLSSGTGKFGGALISSSLENSFFGNRTFELDDAFLERNIEKKQFKPKKLVLALGGKLIRRKQLALDLGIILKRHTEIKRINPGIGLSGRIGPLTIGGAIYQDDFYYRLDNHIDPTTGLPYSTIYNSESYSERFTVATYSLGTKIENLSLDAGVIKTKYKLQEMDTEVHLYSSSYIYQNLMFNLAYRNEITPHLKFIDGVLKPRSSKSAFFTGIQASLGRYLIVGTHYNYFLLDEFSFSATLYF
jgi:hypothetical protein